MRWRAPFLFFLGDFFFFVLFLLVSDVVDDDDDDDELIDITRHTLFVFVMAADKVPVVYMQDGRVSCLGVVHRRFRLLLQANAESPLADDGRSKNIVDSTTEMMAFILAVATYRSQIFHE